MIKTILITIFLIPFISFAQDWPIYGTPDWPSYQKDLWPNYQKDLNDTCDVIPLGVDFGLCAMPLGWALTDSGCVVLSGCGWIGSDGINYQSSFFSSSYECNSACLQDTVVILTSQVQIMANDPILVYPNPSNGVFSLKPIQLGTTLRFYNVYGQLIFSTEVQAIEMKINLELLPKGCYLFTIDNGMRQKLLIE
jgi:hypothetical protein